MSITNLQQLNQALSNNFIPIIGYKQTAQNLNTGQWCSIFRSSSVPPSLAVSPGTTAVALNKSTTGALPYRDPVAGEMAYLGELAIAHVGTVQPTQMIELHDLFTHADGLSANITTPQTITGMDLQTLGGGSNLNERYGMANYAEVTWWMDVRLQTGPTATTATLNVTYHDGSSGDVIYPIGGTFRGGRLLPLNSFIPASDTGKHIRALNSLTLSIATGSVGNIGFTASRFIGSAEIRFSGKLYRNGWNIVGLNRIYSNSCLAFISNGAGVNSAFNNIRGKIIYG